MCDYMIQDHVSADSAGVCLEWRMKSAMCVCVCVFLCVNADALDCYARDAPQHRMGCIV